MGAMRFILRRLAFSAVLILGVSFILFALINAIGNPIEIMLAETPGVSVEMIAALSKFYGLDGGFIDRYGAWLWAILHFDFGTSIIYNQPVADIPSGPSSKNAATSTPTRCIASSTWASA